MAFLMGIFKNLVVNVVVNSFVLWVLSYFNFGIHISFDGEVSFGSSLVSFLLLGAVFWIFDYPIKGLLKLLSLPVTALTLGLFSLVINVLIFYLFAWFVNTQDWGIVVELGNIIQTFILSFVVTLSTLLIKKLVK